MKKLVVEPFTKNIYWASVGKNNNLIIGERKDVTDNAIDSVVNHFILQNDFNDTGFFGYCFEDKDRDITISTYNNEVYQLVFKKDIEKLKDANNNNKEILVKIKREIDYCVRYMTNSILCEDTNATEEACYTVNKRLRELKQIISELENKA